MYTLLESSNQILFISVKEYTPCSHTPFPFPPNAPIHSPEDTHKVHPKKHNYNASIFACRTSSREKNALLFSFKRAREERSVWIRAVSADGAGDGVGGGMASLATGAGSSSFWMDLGSGAGECCCSVGSEGREAGVSCVMGAGGGGGDG